MSETLVTEAPSAAAAFIDREWWRLESIISHLESGQKMLKTGCLRMYVQHWELAAEHFLDGDEGLQAERNRRLAKARAKTLEQAPEHTEGRADGL